MDLIEAGKAFDITLTRHCSRQTDTQLQTHTPWLRWKLAGKTERQRKAYRQKGGQRHRETDRAERDTKRDRQTKNL